MAKIKTQPLLNLDLRMNIDRILDLANHWHVSSEYLDTLQGLEKLKQLWEKNIESASIQD